MAKKTISFICTSCKNEFPKWLGRCPGCDEWNTIVESENNVKSKRAGDTAEAVSLSEISREKLERIFTGIEEFDLVCGGGILPGSVILIGGEPGIGKSTLALQLVDSMKALYVSGEESPAQIQDRAYRLGIQCRDVLFLANTVVDDIIAVSEKESPDCIIVDSVQTLYSPESPGLAGSVSQVKESASRLVELAKRKGMPVILIGHITKDGAIAGPKLLEHIVDTVLYFEGDFSREYRMLRANKNRFGSINEIGLFQMTESGLLEVKNKNSLFINPFSSSSPGNAISAAVEGTRTILFEVQSLVSFTSFTNPRRMSDGFDLNRLILLIAVLEKHAGLKLGGFDVFINLAGGFRVHETAADLAVAMAIASGLKDIPVPSRMGFIAEVSLSGELRPVPQFQRRIQEFERSGFRSVIVSKLDLKDDIKNIFSGEVHGVNNVAEAIDCVF